MEIVSALEAPSVPLTALSLQSVSSLSPTIQSCPNFYSISNNLTPDKRGGYSMLTHRQNLRSQYEYYDLCPVSYFGTRAPGLMRRCWETPS